MTEAIQNSAAYLWAQMVDDFRQLGGTAENIEQRAGQFGNGLFPVDPDQPVAIAVPSVLLVDDYHLVLDGVNLIVDPTSAVPAEVCDFYARYQQSFSWGAEGRGQVESFETGLKTLPESLLERLRQLRLLNLKVRHKGTWDEMLRRQFLQSRRINYHERKVLMPIIELINHSPKSPGFLINDGIQYKGRFTDEVSVNYSPTSDSLLRFLTYGFANQEPTAFCLPIQLKLSDGATINIGSNGNSINVVDKLPLPKVETEGNRSTLSHLRLGIEHAPRLPRTLLRKALPDLAAPSADELFDRLRNANQLELCKLLELADGVNTPIGREFRQAVLYQLKAMTHCFGVRPD